MNKDDYGIKRVCLSCSTKFYDFNKSPIVCPICNTVFNPEYLLKRKAKTFQEKSDDVIDDIDVPVDDGELIDDAEDDLSDADEVVQLDDDKN